MWRPTCGNSITSMTHVDILRFFLPSFKGSVASAGERTLPWFFVGDERLYKSGVFFSLYVEMDVFVVFWREEEWA